MIKNAGGLLAMLCLATAACASARHGRYKSSDTITVTGCVQNNGAKSSATMDGGYMLTATVTGNAGSVQPSAPGSLSRSDRDDPGGSADEMAHHESASYMLDGRDSELRNYIDKRAEITGTLEAHGDDVDDTNSIPTRGSVIPHGRATGLQWLRVASVKVISSDCSARRPDVEIGRH